MQCSNHALKRQGLDRSDCVVWENKNVNFITEEEGCPLTRIMPCARDITFPRSTLTKHPCSHAPTITNNWNKTTQAQNSGLHPVKYGRAKSKPLFSFVRTPANDFIICNHNKVKKWKSLRKLKSSTLSSKIPQISRKTTKCPNLG